MIEFLTSNNLFCSSQYGFLPGRSTLTHLLEYLETLTSLMEDSHAVDVLYRDFRRVFYLVPKERILSKLHSIGSGLGEGEVIRQNPEGGGVRVGLC